MISGLSAVYPLEHVHHTLIFYLITVDTRNYRGTARCAVEALKTPGVELFILTPPNNAANDLGFSVGETQVVDSD